MDTTTPNQDHKLGAAQSTMSESITRRSSSRQLLQNLIRVTAQRSQEDAEEVERERRRRARERRREEGSASRSETPQHSSPTHNKERDGEMNPSSFLVLEEDEGFSDWSHRLENRQEQEVQDVFRAQQLRPSAPQCKPEAGEEKQQEEEEEEEGEQEPELRSQEAPEPSQRLPEKVFGIRKEVRASYSSSVFLPQDNRLQHARGQPADRTSYLAAGTMKPRGGACRMDEEVEQEEQGEVKETMQHTLEEEDDSEEEELSFQSEEKEDLHLGRERHREEEEEEEEEERKMPDKESGDGRSEDTSRPAAPLCCSYGEEQFNCYGPMSPTFKKLLIQFYPDEVSSRVSTDGKYTITERTESLRKSTNSIRKTLPPASVSKINRKLEEYTHAVEVSSKEGRSGCPVLTDLTHPPQPVAYKKNLFEARETWSQSPVTPSKDTDGVKVGVADLINQWVRGSEDGSSCSSPSKPAETGKRNKFVVTGHSKYKKVPDDHSCREDVNCEPAGLFCENS